MSGEKLRHAIFSINTRRFGTVCEAIVSKIANLGRRRNQFHDLYCDKTERRIEVKFSRVQRRAQIPITEDNVLAAIFSELDENRSVEYRSWRNARFDCNIQQIKRTEFDVLYYGLFFWDALLIFRIDSDPIEQDPQVFYSDKQHKGNQGEGQFHISEKTLQHHVDNYLAHEIGYDELFTLLNR